jgi:hypothetical protein
LSSSIPSLKSHFLKSSINLAISCSNDCKFFALDFVITVAPEQGT